jgi:hypothetical protein
MDSNDLTLEQLRALLEREELNLRYYALLLQRMKERGFPCADRLRQQVERARDESMRLRMWLHYRVDEGIKDVTRR